MEHPSVAGIFDCALLDVNTTLPTSFAEVLAGSIHECRRGYRRRLARSRRKFNEKTVHKLRTQTRKTLALLHLLELVGCDKGLKKLRKTFKKRLDSFDGLRDTHVQLGMLKPLWSEHPEARDFKKLLRKREKRLTRGLSSRIRKISSDRVDRKLKKLEKALRPRPMAAAQDADASTRRALAEAFRSVVLLRRKVRRDDPGTIHCMRVAFKRFRYLVELLAPLLPETTTAHHLEGMKEYQTVAGNVQDWDVLLRTLDETLECKDVDAAAMKTLRVELLRRRTEAIQSFMGRIDDFRKFDPALSTRG